MKINVISACKLSSEQLSQWSMLQESNPELASPYFCPEFTVAVASVRPDVYVAVLEDAGQPVGFFPFQRNRLGIGKPVGGALSDYQAVVAGRGLQWDACELLRACRLANWSFSHLIASQKPFERYRITMAQSHFIDLSEGFETYVDSLRKTGSHLLKDVRAKRRRLIRQFGTVRFVPHVAEPGALETLIRWKSAQYRRSGLVDVFSFGWTVELLRRIHATQTEEFSGMLSALYVNDEPAAVHMGMRSRTVWNWWFPRHNEKFAKCSPGILLRLAVAEYAAAIGIKRIDLGVGGETTYKPRLASGSVLVAQGAVEIPSMLNFVRRVCRNAEDWVRRTPLVAVARLPGRVIKRAERRMRFR